MPPPKNEQGRLFLFYFILFYFTGEYLFVYLILFFKDLCLFIYFYYSMNLQLLV